MALAEFKAGAFEQALTSLDALPRGSESEQPDVLYLRGKVMQALRRPDAGEILAQACRAKPQEDYCDDAAILLMHEERLQQAAELLETELAVAAAYGRLFCQRSGWLSSGWVVTTKPLTAIRGRSTAIRL